MIAKHESAVRLRKPPNFAFGKEPVCVGIICGQLLQCGPWFQTDQSALFALDNFEYFRSGVVEAVRGLKQNPGMGVAASGTL